MYRAVPVVLAGTLCLPLRPVLAQGWVDIERRGPQTFAGLVSRVDSRGDLRLAESPVELSGMQPAPGLWAARRIGELTRTIRVEGASPVLQEEIRELGLWFGGLTEYTAYLVQEPPAGGATGAHAPPGGGRKADRRRCVRPFAPQRQVRAGEYLSGGGRAGRERPGGGAARSGAGHPASGRPVVRATGARSGLTLAPPIGSRSLRWRPSARHILGWCECCRS